MEFRRNTKLNNINVHYGTINKIDLKDFYVEGVGIVPSNGDISLNRRKMRFQKLIERFIKDQCGNGVNKCIVVVEGGDGIRYDVKEFYLTVEVFAYLSEAYHTKGNKQTQLSDEINNFTGLIMRFIDDNWCKF